MRALWDWLRRPYDRCRTGNHRMGTKAGYDLCRKHAPYPWGRA